MTQVTFDSSELPVPEQAALTQSNTLSQHIKELIKQADGSISFEQYMSACLYEPGLGYYSAGSHKIGKEGDFITAPEISSLFSRCLANQCAEILEQLGQGIMLELGAGTGRMAQDILLELERRDIFPEAYWILELSADLKQRQQKLLRENIPHLFERIHWLDALPDATFNGVILGNEVLDAMPVCRFVKQGSSFNEMQVGLDGDAFIWKQSLADAMLSQELHELDSSLRDPMPDNYISEFNRGLKPWLDALQNKLEKGIILFIDYGYPANDYYHPDQHDGHLLCHYRHHAHADPFFYPGLQDITASINYTAVAETADTLGLAVSGYTTQTYFLLANGLEDFVSNINNMDIQSQTELAQQMRMLTMPEEMGERFKAIALSKAYDMPLAGFSIMDQRVRL